MDAVTNSGAFCATAGIAFARGTSDYPKAFAGASPDYGTKRLRHSPASASPGIRCSKNGSASGVSATTLSAIASALRLSAAETSYLHRLAEERDVDRPQPVAGALALGALAAIEWAAAYACTPQWNVLAWNRAMSLISAIKLPGGEPFDFVTRMFADPAVRAMHGERFPGFARGLVAMVRATLASRLQDDEYRRMCDGSRTDPLFAAAWETYDLATPMGSVSALVQSSAVGAFLTKRSR